MVHLDRSARGGQAAAVADGSVALRIGLQKGQFVVDRDGQGALRGVSIITRGPALGHGFVVDDVMLKQVSDAINSHAGGVKVRLKHVWGWGDTDGVEILLGRVSPDTRIEDDKVLGDIVFGKYGDKLPGKGDAKGYLLDVADDDPDKIGLSIVFEPDAYEEQADDDTGLPLPPLGRVKDVIAVDFTDDPAANPGGLLTRDGGSQPTATPKSYGERKMNEQLRMYLETIGLTKGVTDTEAIAFWNTRTGAQKQIADSLSLSGIAPNAADPPATGQATPALQGQISPLQLAETSPAAPTQLTVPTEVAAMGEEALRAQAATDALAADRTRRDGIMALATGRNLATDWAQGLCDRGVSLAQATELAELAAAMSPVPVGAGSAISVGEDRNVSSLRDGISDAILLRAGVPLMEFDEVTGVPQRNDDGRIRTREAHERGQQLRRLTLIDLGRQYLHGVGMAGVDMLGRIETAELLLNPHRLAQRIGWNFLAQGTSDFPYILEDTARKSLRAAYAEAPSTWQIWCGRDTKPDYKDFKMLSLSEAPDLVARSEGQGLTYGTLSEGRETAALVEFMGGLVITRKTVVNDDLNAFGNAPRLLAQSGKRKEDDVVYAILTANAAMADGTVLFHADHGNLAGSGAALSVITLGAGFAAMGIQKGIGGVAHLNIQPKFLLVPAAAETTAIQLVGSLVDPAKSNATPNPFANRLTTVPEARLDANSTTAWYLAAEPGRADTVVLVFLEEEQTPVVKQKTDFDTDDVKMAVRHSVVAKAVDHRGLYKNAGV